MPDSLAAALAELQANLPHIGKDAAAIVPTKAGGTYGYKYADLASLTRVILPRLAGLGLVWVCTPEVRDDGKFGLAYMLFHESDMANSIEGFWPIPVGTPQAMGGAVTYARRYCLCAVTGVAPDEDDDDGQAAEQEARDLERRRLPEVDEHGAATFPELERMHRGPVPGLERVTPDAPERTEWDAPEASKPDPMRAAMGAMFALYKELGVTDKDPMLFDISEILDREISSRADLSLEEVKGVNGVLRKRRDAARKAGSVTHA